MYHVLRLMQEIVHITSNADFYANITRIKNESLKVFNKCIKNIQGST